MSSLSRPLLVGCALAKPWGSSRRDRSETLLLEPDETGVGDLGPAGVDGQRVTAVLELHEVGHGDPIAVQAVGRLRDRLRDGAVPADHRQQERTTVWSVAHEAGESSVNPCEIRFDQGTTWRGNRPAVEELVGLSGADRVGEA